MSFKDYQSIFLHAICDMHEHMKYTLCEEEIARFCDIRIIEGKTNEGGSGPPSIVQYVNTRSGQRNRFSILHEIAHVIMQRMNLEEPLIKQGVARGLDGMGFVEATANKAASLLLIPDTSIESATIFWGYHANAVLDLSDTCNASLEATAYRWANCDDRRCGTVIVSKKNKVVCVAGKNFRRPVRKGDAEGEALKRAYPSGNYSFKRLECGRGLYVSTPRRKQW